MELKVKTQSGEVFDILPSGKVTDGDLEYWSLRELVDVAGPVVAFLADEDGTALGDEIDVWMIDEVKS